MLEKLAEYETDYDEIPDWVLSANKQAVTEWVKLADWGTGGAGQGLRPVPVDAFNQAIWNDVRAGMTSANNPYGTKPWNHPEASLHTTPGVAAAATAINTGVQDMFQGRSMLSPAHFVRGLATAGVDMLTARVVGSTLGALGGLRPDAQKKLQTAGVWGGLMRGTVGSMLGL
jgi:hypothetical protein